jgi:hypothetical protein
VNVKMKITGPVSDESLAKYARFLFSSLASIPMKNGKLDPWAREIWRNAALETLQKLMERHPTAAGSFVELVMITLKDEEIQVLLRQVADFVLA